jgi:AraC family transcriptional regulator, regulatory protein of adaptative response / DNA-3-methyladenine glycosylase II
MELSARKECYRALESRDARFDGLLFVGVSSTGVYCRPICPARTPKFEHCSFYGSATAAQESGFRPCLRCRPETAPELASWRGTSNTTSRALALIAEGALDGANNTVEALAERLGVGERQLRRLFLQHFGASPISVAQTRRVLFAKQLLHDTAMPMAAIAMAAGFGSVRRFNETFMRLFQRTPRALRRKCAASEQQRGIVLRLSYRPPYDWNSMLAFFAARAIPGVESVHSGLYLRAIEINGELGSIAVAHLPKQQSLEVNILFPNLKALPAIVARVRRLFDLGTNIEVIEQHLSADPALAKLIKQRPGLRAPGGWDEFEIAIRAVLGQQISVPAARTLAGRLVERHGRIVPRSFRNQPSISRVFPSAIQLASATTVGVAMPAARANALMTVAEATVANPNLFCPLGGIEQTIARLRAIRGIGEWTAQYIALRAIRESDAFPATDLGILRGAALINDVPLDAGTLLRRAEAWRPWRGYAAQHLWAAVANAVPDVSDSAA